LKAKKKARTQYFVPKAIGIISRFDYFDHFNRILEILLDKIFSTFAL
jgi:hypothetical protein